jgi:hypothetical protein
MIIEGLGSDKITQIKKYGIKFAGHAVCNWCGTMGATDSSMTVIDVTLYLEFGKFQP